MPAGPLPGNKRKADVLIAVGQPTALPPQATPPAVGLPMLPHPAAAASPAVMGQPLAGAPAGPLPPLFQSAPGVAAAGMPAADAGGGSGGGGGGTSSSEGEPPGGGGFGGRGEALFFSPGGEMGADGDLGGLKKSRLVWTQELHNRFINALSHLVSRGSCCVDELLLPALLFCCGHACNVGGQLLRPNRQLLTPPLPGLPSLPPSTCRASRMPSPKASWQ